MNRRPAALVVDLDGVEFFGSSGITTLLEARERARPAGAGFAVAASRRPVLRTLQVTDLVEVLHVRVSLPEAVDFARSAV
ncbi:STAS domain-containing protein [Actinosynnema sp. CA-299493]